jgi:hypothetical protein
VSRMHDCLLYLRHYAIFIISKVTVRWRASWRRMTREDEEMRKGKTLVYIHLSPSTCSVYKINTVYISS